MKLVENLYAEVGLARPTVASYVSVDAFFRDFGSWKPKASPFISVFWEYQYPIFGPDGYWARHMLAKSGYKVDISRKANEYGCYTFFQELSEVSIEADRLAVLYESTVAEVISEQPRRSPDRLLELTDRLEATFPFEIAYLDSLLRIEDETFQGDCFDFMILGPFHWLEVEREILSRMRKIIGHPICESHFQNVARLCESNIIFFTFSDSVFCCAMDK